MIWRPDAPGRFRGSLSFRVDSRFPAQVSVVGEGVDVTATRKQGEGREGRKRVKGGAGGEGAGVRMRSLSQEAGGRRGAEPYTSVRVQFLFYD